MSWLFSGEFTPNTLGMSTAVFSNSAFATPDLADVAAGPGVGTQGAGVFVFGVTGVAAVAGGTGE